MNRIKFTLFYFAISIFAILMISCDENYKSDPILFNYNSLKVSARYAWYPNTNYDTITVEKINKNQIQLSITVSDSLKSKSMFMSKITSNINSFETISARSEPPNFKMYSTNQNIVKIEIFTLQYFNDTIQSGHNITNEFLVDDNKPLYTKISNAYSIINRGSYANPYNLINVVCKIPANSKTGQFKVKVFLSDNSVLEAKTLAIQFIENNENK